MSGKTDQTQRVLEAVIASVDRTRLASLLEGEPARPASVRPEASPSSPPKLDHARSVEAALTERMVLADILDDSILSARPGDASYPLRAMLGELGASLADDETFAFAAILNAFFRIECDEETRARIGLEASRAYYRFAEGRLEPVVRKATSPILAQLLSTQLANLRFESVDHATLFDSGAHEREIASEPSGSAVRAARSFLCRVTSNGVVRVKASVLT